MNNILNYALFDNRIKLFWSPFECLNELLLSFRDGQIQVYSLPVTKFTPVHFQKLWSYFQILFWKICFCKFIVILLFSGMLWLKSHSADFSILPKMDSVDRLNYKSQRNSIQICICLKRLFLLKDKEMVGNIHPGNIGLWQSWLYMAKQRSHIFVFDMRWCILSIQICAYFTELKQADTWVISHQNMLENWFP